MRNMPFRVILRSLRLGGRPVDETLQKMKREAGFRLARACEEALGVRGPRALAAVLGRSPAWWSRLSAGKARLPSWPELESWLPREARPAARAVLQQGLLDALLALRGAEALPPDEGGAGRAEDCRAAISAAERLWIGGEYRSAAAVLRCAEALLSPAAGAASAGNGELLAQCHRHLGVCHAHLGDHAAAALSALRAVELLAPAGGLPAAYAEHDLALVRIAQGRSAEGCALLERLAVRYDRLAAPEQRVRADQDRSRAYLLRGQPLAAARLLDEVREAAPWDRIPPDHAFQNLLKRAEAALALGRTGEARGWLGRADAVRTSAGPLLAEHLGRRHVADQWRTLRERAAG